VLFRSDLRTGFRGCFVLGDGKVTVPLVIQTVPIDLGTHVILEVADDMGTPYNLEISPSVEGIEKTSKPNTYLVSNTLPWIEVGRRQLRLQDEPTPKLTKASAEKTKKSLVMLRHEGDGSYSLAGDVGALEGDCKALDRYKAKFQLMGIGLNPNEAELALGKARCNGQVTITGGKVPLTQAEKYGSCLKTAKALERKVLAMRPGNLNQLIKSAAVIDDESTLDKVLSLNLLTPENLKVFLDGLPCLQEAVQRLAQLLVLVRATNLDVPEAAVKRSMEALDMVVDSLSDIQSSQRTNAAGTVDLATAA
jgi:hypothetical protein